MKVPRYMMKAIKNRTITSEILGACAYSLNKRAKNCRDKIADYRHGYGCRKYIGSYDDHEKVYYDIKKKLLSIVEPVCIHETIQLRDVYHDGDYAGTKKVTVYYKYYKVGEYSFHQPIDEDELPQNLPIVNIGKLTTHGKSIDDLLSVDFCRKVLALINSGDYTYIP